MKHNIGHLYFQCGQKTRSSVIARALFESDLIKLYETTDKEDSATGLIETENLDKAEFYEFKGRDLTAGEIEKIVMNFKPKGQPVKKFILFSLFIFSLSAFAQTDEVNNLLQQDGWLNSHHKAYQFGARQQTTDYNKQAVEVYRDMAVGQIGVSGQRVNQIQQRNNNCFRTLNGVQCD